MNPTPHTLAALALAAFLGVFGLLTAPFERAFLRSNPSSGRKLAYYGLGVVLLWVLAGAAVALEGIGPLVFRGDPVGPWPWAPAWAVPVLGVVLAAYVLLALLPLLQSLRGPRQRRAYAAAIRRQLGGLIGAMLPDTAAERLGFALLSLSAGICEEVLFRGFLLRVLHAAPLQAPILLALLVATIAFGLGHAYQGVAGVISTSLAGLALGLLFLLTGSLVLPIILHAVMDLQIVFVLRPFREEAVEATGAPGTA